MNVKKIVAGFTTLMLTATMLATPVSASNIQTATENPSKPSVSLNEVYTEAFSDSTITATENNTIDSNKPTESTTAPTEPNTEAPTEVITEPPTAPTEKPTEKPTEAISPVESFTYSNVTTTSITLNWTKNQNATGYVIYRMDNKTNSKYVKYAVIKNNSTTTYTNKNLTPARCYYYQIKAYLYKDGKYYYSSAKTVKPGTCPNGVKNLTVTSQTDNKIGIKWDKVDGASGYVIYRMDYKTNSKYKAIATVDSTITKISNTNLETGRPYYYRVRAYKDVYGKKFYGDYPTLKTATLPATVTNLKVTSQSKNHISISWDRVPRATGYIIYRMDNTTNSKYKKYDTIKANGVTNYTDDNLIAGRCYYYRVRAYRTVDGKTYYGGYPTLKTGTKTIAPTFNLTTANNKITANWSKVSGAEGYALYVAEAKNAHYYMQGSTTGTSFTTKALTRGKTYYVRVCAYNLVDGKKIYSGYQTKSITCNGKNTVNGYEVGETYIAISINDQHMWYYKNGRCIASTPVVTGMKNKYDTPKGLFHVWEKKSPARLVGPTWDVVVNYWIGITSSGIGLHDSMWRTTGYGSNIYTYDGSHGCINTPYDQVKKIYDNCTLGTPVVVY